MTSILGKWTSTENKAVSTFVENSEPLKSGQIGLYLLGSTLMESHWKPLFSDSRNADVRSVPRSYRNKDAIHAGCKNSEQNRAKNLILSPSYKKGACDDREGDGRPSECSGSPRRKRFCFGFGADIPRTSFQVSSGSSVCFDLEAGGKLALFNSVKQV